MTKTRVPAIPAPTDANLREVARALKGVVEIREGLTGDPLDKGVTFRDLVDGGLADVTVVGRGGGGGSGIPSLVPAPGLGQGSGYDPVTDLTPPPQALSLAATGAFAAVILSWSIPAYPNHAYTEIWRADTNALGSAVMVGTTVGSLYTDYLGNSTGRYYWVRLRSQADVVGAYNAIEGTLGQTAANPGLLLESLTREITESHLFQDLGDRINLIDGAGPGSVNARIASEALARGQAIALETAARVAAVIAESDARALSDATINSAINAEQTARSIADSVLSSSNQALAAGVAGASALLEGEANARSIADSVAAAALAATGVQAGQTAAALASESSSRVEGDVASTTSSTFALSQSGSALAAIQLEQQTRASADEASSQQVSALVASVGESASALRLEQQARADQDGALASQTTTLAASTAAASAGLQVAQQAIADASSAQASQTTTLAAAIGDSVAGLRIEQQARADADQASASQITSIGAQAGQSSAAIAQEQQARADQDGALAAQTTTLAARVDLGDSQNAAGLIIEQQARADADGSIASQTTSLAAQAGNNVSALRVEQEVRSTETQSLALQSTSIAAAVAGSAAGITQEALARAGADSASASLTTSLSASLAGAQAAIVSEEFARVSSDAATASQVTTLAAKVDVGDSVNAAAIQQEQLTRATTDSAQASQTETLSAAVGANESAIRTERDVRSDETQAVSRQTQTIGAAAGSALAGLVIEQAARATSDSAAASQALQLSAAVGESLSGLKLEQDVSANRDGALASQTLGLSAAVGQSAAGLNEERIVRASGEASTASQTQTLAASLSNAAATVQSVSQAQADANASVASRVTTLAASFGDNSSAIKTEQEARATSDSAAASQTQTLGSQVGTAQAAIRVESSTRVNELGAASGQITTLQSSFNGNTVAIQTLAQTTAGPDGTTAQYTVKVDNAGHVSGFGLSSTANNASPLSEFGIRADRFWVAPPAVSSATAPTTSLYKGYVWLDTSVSPAVTKYWSGTAWTTTPQALPFVVRTTGTNPGVYMPAAFIEDGTITNAKIGSLAADKITAGFTESVDLESSTFFGSNFYIGGTATYEFNDPSNPSKKTGIASVSNPSVALSATGAEFAVASFKIKSANNTAASAVFEVVDGVTRIKQVYTQGLAVTDALGNIILASGTNLNHTRITPAAGWLNSNITTAGLGINTFRVVARGNSSTTHPVEGPQLVRNGTVETSGAARSYTLHRIRRSDGMVEFTQVYDVFGAGAQTSGRDAAQLAADLNATTSAYVVVVRSDDEPQTNRLTGGLPAAMYRCGASRAVFGSPQFKYRSAYVLIGIAGCGEGNGAEVYQGDEDNDVDAWVDTGFQIVGGQLVGVSSVAKPRTLADYAYTGDLNATNGASGANLSAGVGSNMLLNGSYRDGLVGTQAGWRSGGDQQNIRRNLGVNYSLGGSDGLAYMVQPGTAPSGTVFDAWVHTNPQGERFNVTPGKRYEVHAWLNTHRCLGYVGIAWYTPAGAYITEEGGNQVDFASDVTQMSDLRQSVLFSIAPPNAASGLVFLRATTNGQADPYLFFARVFLSEAGTAQTEPSPWSLGAGIQQITPANASTYIAGAAIGFALIADDIQSTDYVANTAGWRIAKGGQMEMSNAVFRGSLNIKSAASGARMEITNSVLKVFDASGVVRVKIGDLTA